MLGALILSKEERDKTADFLFAKPIRRSYAVAWKIAAGILNLAVFNLVTFVISIYSVEQYNDTGSPLAKPVFLITTALFFLQVLFFGLGLLLGAVTKNAKSAAASASAFILASFILKVVIDLKDSLDVLDVLTPFRYFDANTVMFDRQIDPVFAILSAALALIGAAGTFYFFQKRDLRN